MVQRVDSTSYITFIKWDTFDISSKIDYMLSDGRTATHIVRKMNLVIH